MSSMSVSAARAEMHQLLDAVARGEEVTLTRHGAPVAVVVRPDLLRARRADAVFADAAEIGDLLVAGRTRAIPMKRGLSAERADEMVADVQAGRATRPQRPQRGQRAG